MATKTKAPISLRIRLKYPDEDTFVASYAPNISRGGIFIQSRTPQPEGTALRFELVLKDDTRLLRGEGYVVWVKEYDASQPAQPYGMGVRFTRLDEDSQRLVDRVLRFKEGAGLTPAAPPARSETQEFRSIADKVELADVDEPQAGGGTGESRRAQPPATTAPAAAATPAAEPIVFERRVRPRPTTADGDGAHERCRWAEAQLQEIIDGASLPAAAVEAALRSALDYALSAGDVSDDDLDGLQELLAPIALPALDAATAREELRQLLGAPAVPDVAPVASEPPPQRERYWPTAAPTPEPAPAERTAAVSEQPAAPEAPAERDDDSGFEEFSPIAESAAPAPRRDTDLSPAVGGDDEEPVTLAIAEPRAAMAVDDPALDLADETMVSSLGAPLGGAEEPAFARPAPYAADELEQPPPLALEDEEQPTIEGLSAAEDTSVGSQPGIEGATLAQPDPWRGADGGPGADDELTDVADSWSQRQPREPGERYDEPDHSTDPDGHEFGRSAADEGLDDVTVDLGREDHDSADDFGTTERSAPELLGDELAQDPDLNNEVFEALAGVRELAAAPPPAGAPVDGAHPPPLEEAPSLELLATRARVGTPAQGIEALPEDAGGDALHIVVDDEEDAAAAADQKPAVRGHKSGLFRRLFGRKDS